MASSPWFLPAVLRELPATTLPLLLRSFLAPRGSPGHDQHTALPPAQPHWGLQGCRARPPALPPALPCPHEAHQPLPLRPVAVVGVGVAFLGEFVEEDRGIEVFAAHLCELQGSLAGDVGLQGAARLQEAVDLAKQAACPLQPTGRASGEAWSSGRLWGHSHRRKHVWGPVGQQGEKWICPRCGGTQLCHLSLAGGVDGALQTWGPMFTTSLPGM